MKFEEALRAMREGHEVVIRGQRIKMHDKDILCYDEEDSQWDVYYHLQVYDVLTEDWKIYKPEGNGWEWALAALRSGSDVKRQVGANAWRTFYAKPELATHYVTLQDMLATDWI